ncbi:nitroreductase family protein [Profundibacterium mesophilum]|uniref:Putative NAD(P)H nitroreductase n=1 Tax=Profundibacterium mesophilum KAUST100406-0324 TaxID=1037889 RepID=A0A921TFP4_9RHOB|nr:nitroreductase [Profundibacterium mesophilum]KAF0676634.1 formyltetrahydrofolate deformylase [Profundibacterium mesophilum KAUST100406-0324]
MPRPSPETLAFLSSRRSRPAKTLGPPIPAREALLPLLQIALRSPDHGKLEPWRLIVLERAALQRLGRLAAVRGDALGREPADIEKQGSHFSNAHLAVAVIACPVPSEKIPRIEQTLSAGAVCMQLLNAALAAGWGANWLSGWASHDSGFAAEGLGLDEGEWIAGLIHIGTESSAPPERPRPDPERAITWMTE